MHSFILWAIVRLLSVFREYADFSRNLLMPAKELQHLIIPLKYEKCIIFWCESLQVQNLCTLHYQTSLRCRHSGTWLVCQYSMRLKALNHRSKLTKKLLSCSNHFCIGNHCWNLIYLHGRCGLQDVQSCNNNFPDLIPTFCCIASFLWMTALRLCKRVHVCT